MIRNSQQSVIFLSAEYPPDHGGIGDYTRALGRALLQCRYPVAVLCRHTAPAAQVGDPPLLAPPLTAWDWSCLHRIAALVREQCPAVLHVQYQTGAFGQHPAICFLPYWIKRSLPNPPKIVVTAHDLLLPYLFPKAGPLRNWVTYRLLADADAVIVTNQEDETRLRRGGDPPAATDLPIYRGRALPPDAQLRRIPIGSNIAVAPPPGYTRAAWRARLGVAPHETLVAYFGLISPTKGLDTLVQALEQLPATRLLVIGGDATTPQDQSYAAQVRNSIVTAGLSARVTITGHCGAEEVSAHLLAADLAALPFTDGASFRRGSLLAALAHGLPTITTAPPNQAAPDQLVDGRSVLLTAPSNPSALADAIRRLEADSPLRMRLAAAARDLAQQFSWERIAAAHGELYGML